MSAAFLGYEARWTVACKLVWPIYISIYSYFEKGCRKKARDNPDRYCGWFWVPFPSKKFGRMAGEAMDVCLRVLKESNKSRFDSYSVRKSVLIISHRDCQVHFFFRQSFSKQLYMLWFNFIHSLFVIFFCFWVWQYMIMSLKQKKIKVKLRIKLNHNIYPMVSAMTSSV